MLNTIDFMALNAKYQKFKPNVALKNNKKKWWHFAYNAIIETQIRPRINQFKWTHIKLITNTRKEYVKLLKKKMKKGSKLTNLELELETVCLIFLILFIL
jgi:vacuolar protein sorting-associated protein 13A/C